jgi:hypothetical protein
MILDGVVGLEAKIRVIVQTFPKIYLSKKIKIVLFKVFLIGLSLVIRNTIKFTGCYRKKTT